MSTIHFVGGEKGGVGKSVLSRLISQYFLDHNLLYAGLDADQSHNTLARFYPEFTSAINLDDYESADKIVETAVESDINVVVDLPAQSERFLSQWMDDNDVTALFDDLGIQFYYWYVVDDGRDSAKLVTNFLSRYAGKIPCTLVRNFGRGTDFSVLDEALSGAGLQPNAVIDLPQLHAQTMRHIDGLDLNFWSAGHLATSDKGNLSLMERQRCKVWMAKAYSQLDRVMINQPTKEPIA